MRLGVFSWVEIDFRVGTWTISQLHEGNQSPVISKSETTKEEDSAQGQLLRT